MPEVDFDFLIFELQQSALESEYKLKQDLLKFKYGRIKSGTSDSPSPSNSVPVAASKSGSTLSAVISTRSHPPTVSSTVHSTPSIVPASQHVAHHPVSSTQNTQHIHVSSAEFVPRSSGIQLDNSPSVVFPSHSLDTVCSTHDSSKGSIDNGCISSGSGNDVHCVVQDRDQQSRSLHIQDSPSPSKVIPPDCQDSSNPQHIDLCQSEIGAIDISTESSVSDIIPTCDVSVVDSQFNDISSSCSCSSTKDSSPSPVSCTTLESVVVSCQSDAEVSTHVLLSNVVVFMCPSHYGSLDRFSSQFCYVLCTQKTDLSTILTVSFSSMKSVIVVLSLGFIDSDRRFLKRRRKVGI